MSNDSSGPVGLFIGSSSLCGFASLVALAAVGIRVGFFYLILLFAALAAVVLYGSMYLWDYLLERTAPQRPTRLGAPQSAALEAQAAKVSRLRYEHLSAQRAGGTNAAEAEQDCADEVAEYERLLRQGEERSQAAEVNLLRDEHLAAARADLHPFYTARTRERLLAALGGLPPEKQRLAALGEL